MILIEFLSLPRYMCERWTMLNEEIHRRFNPRMSIRCELRWTVGKIGTIPRYKVRFPDFRGNLPQFVAHVRVKCKAHVGRIMQAVL